MQTNDEFTALLRGGTAGAAALCVVALPLDVGRHAAQAAISKKQPLPQFREALRAAATPRTSGLFRGLGPALCCSSLSPLAFLLSYEVQRGSTEVIEAGLIAKAVQVTLVQPFDFFRTCRQAAVLLPEEQTSHLLRTPWEVTKSEGLRSMWRGWIPSILRDVPAAGLYWHGYMQLTSAMFKEPWEDWDRQAVRQRGLSCAVSSSVCAVGAALLTQPMDVVKTKMQIHRMRTSGKSGYPVFTVARFWSTLREIGSTGWRSLWVGSIARSFTMAAGGLFLGPLFEYAHLLRADADRPLRQPLMLGEDPGRTIVHPRSTRDMFIDVKGT